MNLRLLGGSGALSRFPRVVAPLGAANWEANWEASGQELGHLFSWRDQAVMQSEFKQPTYQDANAQHQDEGDRKSVV